MHVTGQLETLFNQAKISVAEYFDAACDIVDSKFDEGFVAAHPQLAGQLVTAMALDFATTVFAKAVGELSEGIAAVAVGRA